MVPTGENAYRCRPTSLTPRLLPDAGPLRPGKGLAPSAGNCREEPAAGGEDGLFHAHYDLRDVPFTAIKDKGDGQIDALSWMCGTGPEQGDDEAALLPRSHDEAVGVA